MQLHDVAECRLDLPFTIFEDQISILTSLAIKFTKPFYNLLYFFLVAFKVQATLRPELISLLEILISEGF